VTVDETVARAPQPTLDAFQAHIGRDRRDLGALYDPGAAHVERVLGFDAHCVALGLLGRVGEPEVAGPDDLELVITFELGEEAHGEDAQLDLQRLDVLGLDHADRQPR
jgi:hypothetical protein